MDSTFPTTRSTARDRTYRCEAIVLRRMELGEADRILTLLTDRFGKMRAIAKGVRRPTSRLGPHLELFTQASLMISRGRDLDLVTSAEAIELNAGIRKDLDALGITSHCVELVDRFLADRDENRAVYRLLVHTLTQLNAGANPVVVGRWFELALLGEMGVRPELFRCVVCDRPVEAEPNRFSARLGGVLCSEHVDSDVSALTLSVAAQKVLRHMLRSTLDEFLMLAVNCAVLNEIESVQTEFIKYQLERDLNSLKVMRRVEETLPGSDSYRSTK